jgi:hypothetical protein
MTRPSPSTVTDERLVEIVAKAIGDAERQSCGGYPHEGDGPNPWLTEKHVLFARAALEASGLLREIEGLREALSAAAAELFPRGVVLAGQRALVEQIVAALSRGLAEGKD